MWKWLAKTLHYTRVLATIQFSTKRFMSVSLRDCKMSTNLQIRLPLVGSYMQTVTPSNSWSCIPFWSGIPYSSLFFCFFLWGLLLILKGKWNLCSHSRPQCTKINVRHFPSGHYFNIFDSVYGLPSCCTYDFL